MGLLSNNKSRQKTAGFFDSRKSLERFVINLGKQCVQIKEIQKRAGVSRTVVDNILREHNVSPSETKLKKLNGTIKMLSEMEEVYRIENKHLREENKKPEVYRIENKHLREENKKLKDQLKALKWEWPDETRMDTIGQNGNNGEHYAKLNDSHTTEINNAKESN